jgi:hypothetical protein
MRLGLFAAIVLLAFGDAVSAVPGFQLVESVL